MATILLAEDNEAVRLLTQAKLRHQFTVVTAANGRETLDILNRQHVDLIVADVMMPVMDGYQLVRTLRAEGNEIPVLFLTARDDTQDKVMGLTVGGDDYVTKPFSLEEVVARIRAILRRTREQVEDDPIIRVGDLEINEDSHDVSRAGHAIDLSPTEYKLLRYLMDNEGRVLS